MFSLFFLWNEYRTLLTCFGLSFQSYKDLTGTSWTLVYFISFYLITVLLLLNLVSYILPLHYLSSLLLYDSQRQHNGYGPSSPTNRENVVQKQDEGNFFFFFLFIFPYQNRQTILGSRRLNWCLDSLKIRRVRILVTLFSFTVYLVRLTNVLYVVNSHMYLLQGFLLPVFGN